MTDTVEAQEQQEQVTEQLTELTINDLHALRAIIDLASSRGAIKTTEMLAVGTVYNKLNSFLEMTAKQIEAGAN